MPPTAKKELDEEKYLQQQQQLEIELGSLRKEYLILDRDHARTQQHGVSNKLSKNNKVLEIVKNEYLNIITDLAVAASPEKKREDNKMFDYLHFLVYQYGVYDNAVKAEKTYMEELDGQIKIIKKSVYALRKKMTTDSQHQERAEAAVQTCATLENKLEVQVKKFNLVCAKNKESRMEIDHLLWERRNFIGIWTKLIEKLSIGKKIMLDLIEQATIAYDQREDWCNKLQALRIRAHNDLLVNIDDMRNLKRKGDHAKKLEQFYLIKGKKRILKDLQEKQRQKRAELQEKLQEKLTRYKEMVNDITEFTKEYRTDVIAKNYFNQEGENFMYFNYINDMIQEMETVNDYLGFLHVDIQEKKLLQANRKDQQGSNLSILERKLKKAEEDTKNTEQEVENLNSRLKTMMDGIENMVKLCRCNTDPLLELLGDNTKVKSYNVLFYLQILEKQVHECLIRAGLRDKLMSEKKKGDSQRIFASDYKVKMQIYPIEKIVPTSPCSLCVEHDMVSDVFDKVEKVWSRRMAKRKLTECLGLPEGKVRLHNISRCHLPRARQLLQKRYE